MAYPIHPSEGFYRTPALYPHDAFGVDTGGRVRPHSGGDATPRVANCPARSVLGGRVVQTGYTIYAGHYVVELAPDGWLWLSLHLARLFVKAKDTTRPNSILGVVGNTGGGGGSPLKGNAAMGKHIHVSRCRDMAAVERIINGRVRARLKGETAGQWAAAHGLSDPYPHILASLKTSPDKTKDPAERPSPPAPIEEDLMAGWLPQLYMNKIKGDSAFNVGIAVHPDGTVEPLGASAYGAWRALGARAEHVTVNGHWGFLQREAEKLRKRLKAPAPAPLADEQIAALATEIAAESTASLEEIVRGVLEATGVTVSDASVKRIADEAKRVQGEALLGKS